MARNRKAKLNAKGRNANEQFFKLGYAMARSPAFRSLGGGALKVFLELRTRFNGKNNGELITELSACRRVARPVKIDGQASV